MQDLTERISFSRDVTITRGKEAHKKLGFLKIGVATGVYIFQPR